MTAKAGKPDRLLTLTANPAWGLSPAHRAQALVLAWRKLRKRLLDKDKKKKIPFIAVFEKTKKGEPHLHVLLRGVWLDQQEISAHMAIETASPIVDIRKIKNDQKASNYVAKYAAKDPVAFSGCKRFWQSRDYPLEKLSKEENPFKAKNFFIISQALQDLKKSALQMGLHVIEGKSGTFFLHYGVESAKRDLNNHLAYHRAPWQKPKQQEPPRKPPCN